MAGRARTALRLLKPKVSPAASAGSYLSKHVALVSRTGGRRTLQRNLSGWQMPTRLGIAVQRTHIQRRGDVYHLRPRVVHESSREALTGMCWSCQRRYLASEQGKDDKPKKPRPKLVESTRKLREQVQSRLANLTPHENIYTVPNALTFSRLLAAPAIGYLVLHDYHAWAVVLFAYAGITDLVDGYIARKWKLETVVGSVIDPMADKALMFILTVCLAAKGAIPCMS